MMSKAAIDFTNPAVVWKTGIKALSEALTPVGMAYFFRQIEPGAGNYTEEREELTKHYTTESIMEKLMAMREDLDAK
jgi:hypothetical protein